MSPRSIASHPDLPWLRALAKTACTLLAALSSAEAASNPNRIEPAHLEFFEKKIRPVLVEQCYDCHSSDGKAKGDLALDTREGIRDGGRGGPAVIPFNLDGGSLLAAISYTNQNKMPPEKKGGKLSDEVIADFQTWIKLGAPDPRDVPPLKSDPDAKPPKNYDWAQERGFWSFQKPKAVAPPAVKNTKWPRTDIDRFLLAKLEEKGLKPVPDADRRTLIRRITFDLTGLPPTPQEVEAFAKDSSSKAYEKLVDRLIASPRFGEQWGRHWLDVARYGESSGKDRNITFPYAWRYRDYVVKAVNEDKPVNRFIHEQLAGDLLPASSDQERDDLLVATGFLAIGPKGLNETRPKHFKWDIVDDQIDATSRAFLGLTVACARCHDHKFDAIGTHDYHALGGIFASTETLYGTLGGGGNRRPSVLHALAGEKEYPLTVIRNVGAPNAIANTNSFPNQASNQVQLASAAPGGTGTGAAGGGGASAVSGAAGTNTNAPVLVNGQNRARNRRPATGRYAMGVREGRIQDAPVYFRGDLEKPRDVVQRGVVRVVSTQTPVIPEGTSGRLQLAEWITSAENPLTARVFVNRAWLQLFGNGLVGTPDNFGKLGEAPTHPELLDFLAVNFAGAQQWSLKKLVRSLVLTRAYQLGSEVDPKAIETDPLNRFVWRFAPRRLGAESIRDAILAASGELDLTPPTNGSRTATLGNGYIGANIKDSEFKVEHKKRSLYLPIVRDLVPEELALFDFADPNLVTAKREDTSSPTQALYLLNNDFVLAQSRDLARDLLGAKEHSDARRIRDAYATVYSRPPTRREIKNAKAFVGRQEGLFAALPASRAADGQPASTPEPSAPKQGADSATATAAAGAPSPGTATKAGPADERIQPREAAWASFTQALFGSAEFRYLR